MEQVGLDQKITAESKRKLLISALRGDFPESFSWDFDLIMSEDDCGTTGCAIGLAVYTHILSRDEVCDSNGDFRTSKIGRALGLSDRQVRKGLMGHSAYTSDEVSPLEVASWLEAQ